MQKERWEERLHWASLGLLERGEKALPSSPFSNSETQGRTSHQSLCPAWARCPVGQTATPEGKELWEPRAAGGGVSLGRGGEPA